MMMMIMKMRKKRRKTLQNFAFLAFYCVLFFYIPHCGIINLKGNQPLLEFAEQSNGLSPPLSTFERRIHTNKQNQPTRHSTPHKVTQTHKTIYALAFVLL